MKKFFCSVFVLIIFVAVASAQSTSWINTFGGDDYDVGWELQQSFDGGYIISGTTVSSGAGSSDMYLIKTDSEGCTGVETSGETMSPLSVALPNPSTTDIVLTLTMISGGMVETSMFDVSGRLIDFWSGICTAGERDITLTASCQGIHFIRVVAPGAVYCFSTVVIN